MSHHKVLSPPSCVALNLFLLSPVSLYRVWLISVPPALDCLCPKCQGKERHLCLSHFLFLVFPIPFLSLYIYIFVSGLEDAAQLLSHQVQLHVHSPAMFFPLWSEGLSPCLFPLDLTGFNLLILSSPQAKATVPLLSPTASAACFMCFIWYVGCLPH